MAGFNHTPYDGSASPFTMGLSPCEEAEWIEPDVHFTDQLRQKHALMNDDLDAVYRTTDGMHEAESELAAMLVAHLPVFLPDLYQRDGDSIRIKPLDLTLRQDRFAAAPLALAGRLVQEDLCLIRPLGDGRHGLGAASLCFPSSWALADKIGRPLEEVHGPVPGYASDLAGRVNRLFTRLPAGQILSRLNWSLDEGAALHRPKPHSHDVWLDAGAAPLDHIHIRTERQTVRRLPQAGMVLFTIKIGLDPLSALATHPRAAPLITGLHDQLAGLTEAQAAYKGLARARPAILQRLALLAKGLVE